jgi:peptide/nickel transport system permease protein
MVSFFLGILLGGHLGSSAALRICYPALDRIIISIPQIPLWMALSAAIPREWTVFKKLWQLPSSCHW